MRCTFDAGEYCEYLSEDLRPDEGLSHPCVVPSHPSLCIYYQESGTREETEEEFLIKLLDDDGNEVD